MLAAQSVGSATGPVADRILGGTEGLQPAIAVDLLLQVAESGRVSAARRQEAITDAIATAPQLAQAWPLAPAFGGDVDTLAANRAAAAGLGLDRLSVQLRAARAQLDFNPPLALESFEAIPLPQLPVRTCRDATGYDLTAFFQLLGRIRKFTAKQIAAESPVLFYARYLQGITSPTEIRPAANFLEGAQLPQDQKALLAAALGRGISALPPDPRLVSWSAAGDTMALLKLSGRCRVESGDCAAPLTAYRNYLAQAIQAGICTDASQVAALGILRAVSAILTHGETAPLDLTSPSITVGVLHQNTDSIWQTPGAASLLTEWRAVRQNGFPAAPGVVENFIARVQSWDASGMDPEAAFLTKTELLEGPIRALPNGDTRQSCVADLVDLLDSSPIQNSAPLLWILAVHRLVTSEVADPGRRSRLAAALAQASSGSLEVYGAAVDLQQPEPKR